MGGWMGGWVGGGVWISGWAGAWLSGSACLYRRFRPSLQSGCVGGRVCGGVAR